MPELLEPRSLVHVEPEELPYKFFGVDQPDTQALATVNKTFQNYSTWRQSNHDNRWLANDRLYHGIVPKKNWKGTNIPRHSLGIQIAFDQVQTAYPQIVNEVLGRSPYWFGVEATPFSTPEQAAQVRANLAYHFDTPWGVDGTNSRLQIKLSIQDLLQHGNGVLEVGWDQTKNVLTVEHVDLRDFYFDPGTTSSIIDKATSVIRRKMVTVEQMEELREVPGFKIPDSATLNLFSKTVPSHIGDQTVQQSRSQMGEQTHTGQLHRLAGDPVNQKLELLEYWTDHRMIWVLNRKLPILNTQNPYGFKPFVMGPLYIVLGRAYAMSMPDVVEGEQQIIQGLTNSRLDELALGLHPSRDVSRGNRKSTPLTWGPGTVSDVEDVAQVTVHFPTQATASAFTEAALAEKRAMRRTGQSELAQSGVPTPSNANRTAQGMRSQGGATSSRLLPIVENIEDYMLEPLLYKAQRIIDLFTKQDTETVPGRGEEGAVVGVPREVLGTPVLFKMSAASRMVSRERLSSLIQPITSVLVSPQIGEGLQKQGLIVDWKEWSRFLQDATGTNATYEFFRSMTEEESQVASQPPPEVQAAMAQSQLEAQTRLQMGEMKSKTELQTTQMETQSKQSVRQEQSMSEILRALMEERNRRSDNKSKERIERVKGNRRPKKTS